MSAASAELDELVSRLLASDEAIRERTRQEIRAWPIEKAAEIINLAARQELTKQPRHPSAINKVLQSLWPTKAFPQFPTPYDFLVIVYAESVQDARFLTGVINVLSRYYSYKKISIWHTGDAEQDGPSPYWSGGFMMKQQSMRIRITGLSRAQFELLERPLTSALLRLLPQIKPGQNVFSAYQRQTLLRVLRFPYRDVELTLCLLDFLASAGGEEAVAPIEQIHRTAIATENGNRVRIAANTCLEQICSRVKSASQAQTLLRPANDDALAAPETLLRPVTMDGVCVAEELLRPEEATQDQA